MSKRILECSSAGDARFSAFYATVEVNGVTATIEEHYQLSKRFSAPGSDTCIVPQKISDAKGMRPSHLVINGKTYEKELLTFWYRYLWIKYLDANPNLVAILSHYDDYNDKFKTSPTSYSQADAIRDYMTIGRDVLWDRHAYFYDTIETP